MPHQQEQQAHGSGQPLLAGLNDLLRRVPPPIDLFWSRFMPLLDLVICHFLAFFRLGDRIVGILPRL